MAKLLLTSENFAFGPIGKLLSIAELLIKERHELSFAGYGTSLQLAEKFPFAAIHEVDTDSSASTKKLEDIISKCDVLISSMDLRSIEVAQRLKKPVVWVDCLFWFWDELPEATFSVDLFIRERLMDDTTNDSRFATKIKNMYSVGPIIGHIPNKERTNQVLISFGGAEATYWYKVGKDSNYPFVMTNLLSEQIDWAPFKRILLATSERVASLLKEKFPNYLFEFVTLPHDKFLAEMAESEVILITPGLVTAEAAFYSGTPTIFLPPSNDSQYLQLDEFEDKGLAPASAHLAKFMPPLNLKGIPPKQSIKEVLRQLQELGESPEIQSNIGFVISDLIMKRKRWSPTFINNGKKFIDSLGGNGLQPTVDKINELLKNKGIDDSIL